MLKQPVSSSNLPKLTNRSLILILLISLLVILLSQWSYLWDQYRVVKDIQNLYWMAGYQDPTLFAIDYLYGQDLVEINLFEHSLILYPTSMGYGLIFFAASFVINHIWLSKWFIFILVPVSIGYLYKLAVYLEDTVTAISLSLIFLFFILASSQALSPATGLQRGMAVPLLIALLYYLVRKRYMASGAIIVLNALIYWPNFVLAVVAYGLSFIQIRPPFKVSVKIERARLLPFISGILISFFLIGVVVARRPELFLPNNTSISQNPTYQSDGAAPMFLSFPWLGRAGIFNIGSEVLNFFILLVLGFLVYKVVGRKSFKRLPAAYWHLLAAGILMYAASFFVLFVLSSSALYFPSRYTRTTLILCAILYVGLNWGDFLQKAPKWFRNRARQLIFFVVSLMLAFGLVYLVSPDRLLLVPLIWFLGVILSGLVTVLGASSIYWWLQSHRQAGMIKKYSVPGILLFTVLAAALFNIRTLGTKMMNPTDNQRAVYEFVATLPKEAVFAGDPELMSGIPLFSKRSVLFRELHPNANPNVTPLILDYYDAQYAESPQTILDMCRRYQVSYLVPDMTEFESDYLTYGQFFYQPWNDEIVKMVRGRSDFVLLQAPPIFSSGPFRVIRCDDTLLNDISK